MPRFKANRWWTLILTLCLGCVFVSSLSTQAIAESRINDDSSQGDWGGGSGGVPPPPGAGDPDIPMSSVKRALRDAAVRPAASITTARVAGDGTAVDSVMMWHFRVALQSLRLWSFVRF